MPFQTPQEIHEYVVLWERVQGTRLHENNKDSIRWRWIVDEEYITKSAYQIQFEGSFSKLRLTPIWKAGAKPKCKYFAWMFIKRFSPPTT